MTTACISQVLVNLDAWLETMRQPGGYGGPVAHWWQNVYHYTGPGLDWRYEGILIGYSTLLRKTRDATWRERINRAAADLMEGQRDDGSYRASRFELNPGTLGTPHEAAATLGLLTALPCLCKAERALQAAKRNLDNLIVELWDERCQGFDDRPGIPGRVPNKLATLAQALIMYTKVSGNLDYLPYARAALNDILRYTVVEGPYAGAVHQYAPAANKGDGRFFPYYAARCVPPLVLASDVFAEVKFLDTAKRILGFIQRTMNADGSWPQIVYGNGRRADWPRWLAGTADLLLAYHVLGEPIPQIALERLLASQLPSGGFRTGHGFGNQIEQQQPDDVPDYRDVTPVVGWNDKVLRLLAQLLEDDVNLPSAGTGDVGMLVTVWGKRANFQETVKAISLRANNDSLYLWNKAEPWAQVKSREVGTR